MESASTYLHPLLCLPSGANLWFSLIAHGHAGEPPDSDLAEGLSLPALMTRHSPTGSGMPKRRRDSMRPSTAYAPGDVSHEGSPEEDLKKRLRGWQVETLKRKLSDQGECITGLRKAELVERLAKYGEGIFASPTQRIAPAGPVPKVRSVHVAYVCSSPISARCTRRRSHYAVTSRYHRAKNEAWRRTSWCRQEEEDARHSISIYNTSLLAERDHRYPQCCSPSAQREAHCR